MTVVSDCKFIMGFLDDGAALNWPEAKQVADYVKEHGVIQFLNLYTLNKDRIESTFKWGEELGLFSLRDCHFVEYQLVEFSEDRKTVKSTLGASKIVAYLEEQEKTRSGILNDFHPEFSDCMVEALPNPPYDQNMSGAMGIEVSMRSRREKIEAAVAHLFPGRKIENMSITAFPLLGAGANASEWLSSPLHSAELKATPETSSSRSVFLPETFTNPHPRYSTLLGNIRQRRGSKVVVTRPLFKDVHTGIGEDWALARDPLTTRRFEVEALSLVTKNPLKDSIYMDGMGFGMGLSCLQVTFLAKHIHEARRLTDAFATLAPMFLPLTAATPFLRGLVAATDCRWEVISQSVDCRTEEEIASGAFPRSRYAGVSLYMGGSNEEEWSLTEALNDAVAPNDARFEAQAIAGGVDRVLARHIGFLFSRDPLVIYDSKIELNDSTSSAHFENLQSTNWNSARFKPPPPSSDGVTPASIGWRVEFRTPELQLTDFENAAIAAVLLVFVDAFRAHPEWDVRGLMSSCLANISKASDMNIAIKQERIFRVRRDWRSPITSKPEEVDVSLGEFFCGGANFHGLFPLLTQHLNEMTNVPENVRARLNNYISFLGQRATGALLTNAAFFRRFLAAHPSYKMDSVLPMDATADLLNLCTSIQRGDVHCPELLGSNAVSEGVPIAQKVFTLPPLVTIAVPPPCRHCGPSISSEASPTGAGLVPSFPALPHNNSSPAEPSTTMGGEDLAGDCPWCGQVHADETLPPVQKV